MTSSSGKASADALGPPTSQSTGGAVSAESFRAIHNPATGETIEFIAPSSAELVAFNWRSAPGGAIPEHVHPVQDERFSILAGEAHFVLDGVARLVSSGESIVVPAGTPHSVANLASVEVKGVVELRPALSTRQMFEALGALASEGRTDARGAPKNPLQLGATIWRFRHESRVTSPPIWLQNIILPLLAALARVFGVRPYLERWDSRTDSGQARPITWTASVVISDSQPDGSVKEPS
jgi:quercetin dioxygenase-like cupin family protein